MCMIRLFEEAIERLFLEGRIMGTATPASVRKPWPSARLQRSMRVTP